MSVPTADEDAQIIALLAASATSNYIAIVITALLVYEWLIGLGKEINLFWREKFTMATALFLLNRYAPLAYMLSSFSGASAATDKVFISLSYIIFRINHKSCFGSCNASVLTSFTLDILQYVPWALFSGLRTYALRGKQWTVAVPVLILSAVPIGIYLTHLHWSHGEVVPVWGCSTITVVPDNVSLISTTLLVSILPRSSLIVADAIVVVVTWMTTYSSAVTGGFSHRSVPSIAQRLFVNGTIYFITLLTLNVLHLTFTLLSIATHGDESSYIISFTEPITAILVSRFMFDLQKAKQKSQHRGDLSGTLVTGFDRALGSIGSTLSTADVWRLGPEPALDCDHEGRGREDVIDMFGKGAVTSMILEPITLRGRGLEIV